MDRRSFLLLTAAASTAMVAPAVARTPWPSDVRHIYNDILGEPDALALGNPRARATVVEFFDYQCPHCRQMHGRVERLVADAGVNMLCKEWPILGEASDQAARAAIAAHFQGRYAETHAALMRTNEPLDEGAIVAALAAAGADIDRIAWDLRERMVPIERRLRITRAQAKLLQLTASPAFIGGQILRVGPIDDTLLANLVRAARRATTRQS